MFELERGKIMKNFFTVFFILIIVGYSNLYSQNSSAYLDSFITAKMEQYHFPGLQAVIVKDDQIIWKGAYGYANIAQNRLVTDSTLFYIASVSKTVTATALMQLWEQGLFNLDDDVNDYLPFPVRNPNHPNVPITFRMLLTHTSGIMENNNVLNSSLTWGEDSPIPLDTFLDHITIHLTLVRGRRDQNGNITPQG
jgi:CubicO group peptidase (beta-lactamase class C family)